MKVALLKTRIKAFAKLSAKKTMDKSAPAPHECPPHEKLQFAIDCNRSVLSDTKPVEPILGSFVLTDAQHEAAASLEAKTVTSQVSNSVSSYTTTITRAVVSTEVTVESLLEVVSGFVEVPSPTSSVDTVIKTKLETTFASAFNKIEEVDVLVPCTAVEELLPMAEEAPSTTTSPKGSETQVVASPDSMNLAHFVVTPQVIFPTAAIPTSAVATTSQTTVNELTAIQTILIIYYAWRWCCRIARETSMGHCLVPKWKQTVAAIGVPLLLVLLVLVCIASPLVWFTEKLRQVGSGRTLHQKSS